MTVLLLRLAGPLQSWGASSRFTRRHTRAEPTKSGVLGLLAAAEGRRRTDPIEDLAQLSFGVRVDQPGRLLRDFQTAHRPSDGAVMPLSYRYYLADAMFVAAVEGEAALMSGLDQSLHAPTFPLYLGRRSCPVSGRLSLGLRDGTVESTLRAEPWQASPWRRRQLGRRVDLALVLDGQIRSADADESVDVVRDVPESFDPERREYGWREVTVARPVTVENADGREGMDFMAVLGGH